MTNLSFYLKIFLVATLAVVLVASSGELSFAQMQITPKLEIKNPKPMQAVETPELALDKTSYKTSETMKITIKHFQSNKDPKVTEKFSFVVYSTKNPTEKPFDAKETGPDTGVFLANLPVDQITNQDDTVTVALTGIYSSVKKSVTTIAPCVISPTLELDKKVYTWTDEVFITIKSPCNNLDSNLIDRIGDNQYPLTVVTKGSKINLFPLVESGTDTGIFSGRVTLTGFNLDADGDGISDTNPQTSIIGPGNGLIQTISDDGITMTLQFNGKSYSASSKIQFNLGEISFIGDQKSDFIKIRVIDQDLNINHNSVDDLTIQIISDDDSSGIKINLVETGKSTGVFEETVSFTADKSTGNKLKANPGSMVTAAYIDKTLPPSIGNNPIKTDFKRPGGVLPLPSYINPELTVNVPTISESNQYPTLQSAIDMLSKKLALETLPTSSLVTVLGQKENVVKSKEGSLASTSTSSNFLVEQEELLLAKIDYLNTAQQFINSGQAPIDFINAFNSQVEEVKEERKSVAYAALPNRVVSSSSTHYYLINPIFLPELFFAKSLDTTLYLLATDPNPIQYAKKAGLLIEGQQIKVVLDLKNSNNIIESQIKSLGGTIEATGLGQLQINIPIDKIQQLAEIDSLKTIRPPSMLLQHQASGAGQRISEGVAFINADIVQQGGYTGKQIHVAVLDLAFDPQNPEISQNIKEQKSFRKSFGSIYPIKGNSGEYVHGTAVSEIIVDVAPDVSLHLYTIGTEVEFQEAVNYAISRGDIDIIAMSAGWLNYQTDGQSPMSKKLEDAVNKGITVVISSGNYAESHWEGVYIDSDSNEWHEFNTGDEGLRFDVEPGKINPIIVNMMWKGSANLDLYLFQPSSNGVQEIIAFSQNKQTGTSDDVNLETITFNPIIPGTYHIGIHNSDSTANRIQIELFSPTHRLEYSIPEGSVSVPTDAQGIIAVGAIHHSDASLEPYSSQGPTNNGKQVPNVMGPDAVSTYEYSKFCEQARLADNIEKCKNFPFYGTSAAAPYVAGAAALLLEQHPDYSPSQVLNQIQSNADKKIVLLSSSSDNVYGHGKLDTKFIVLNKANEAGLDTTDATKSFGLDRPKPTSASSSDYSSIDDSIPAENTRTSDTSNPQTKQNTQMTPSAFDQKSNTVQRTEKAPSWIKDNVLWWSNGAISDDEFVNGIQYLIQNDIMKVDSIPERVETETQKSVPEWVKTNSKWWAFGQITEDDFLNGMEYLVKEGIIKLD